MGDVEHMKELVTRLIEENTKMAQESARRDAEHKDEMNRLIEALAQRPQVQANQAGVVNQQPDPVAVRASAVSRVALGLRKSQKLKDFKHCQESDIKKWLRMFDIEIEAIKKIAGINGNLERQEYVDLLKDKLDYQVLRRLETAFPARDPVLRWDTVTKAQLHKCLLDEFGPRESDVSAVLLQFGSGRCKKTSEMSVSEYFHLWQEQIPDCMSPSTDQERIKFVDLIRRSLFYYGLEDTYLQQQICDHKDDDPSLKKFMTLLVRLSKSVKVSRLLVCQVASWTVQQMWQFASLLGGKTRNEVLAVKVATVASLAGKLRKLGRARSKDSAPSSSH